MSSNCATRNVDFLVAMSHKESRCYRDVPVTLNYQPKSKLPNMHTESLTIWCLEAVLVKRSASILEMTQSN